MTSFSSSGISGSSNGSYLSNQGPHHHHHNYTPMRVHFTDGSMTGSTFGVPNPKEDILKVILSYNVLGLNTSIIWRPGYHISFALFKLSDIYTYFQQEDTELVIKNSLSVEPEANVNEKQDIRRRRGRNKSAKVSKKVFKK